MILTKAYITAVPGVDGNEYKVRIPAFEDNTNTEAIFTALLCTTPGMYNGYSVGDCVYVHFEDEIEQIAVILGKLYTEVPSDTTSYALVDSLKVSSDATLPDDTRFGDVSIKDLINRSAAGGGGGGGTGGKDWSKEIEDINRRIKFTDWVIEQEGPNLNFYRKYNAGE